MGLPLILNLLLPFKSTCTVRYLYLLFIGILLVSCNKEASNDDIVETHYKYRNNTSYRVDINVYRKAVSLIQFNYTVRPYDSLELDFRNVAAAAPPFGAPEVDSAEVIFDGNRKIIYSLDGENGLDKTRNIFNRKDPSYLETRDAAGRYNYLYEFSNTDYYNAR